MPLAFDSLSHGKIAFGFFNIETDLLLLNRHFFFASDFCSLVLEMVEGPAEGNREGSLPGYALAEERIGDLMGAIHGTHFQGFIGAVYRLYPFPENPEGFRQNPEGFRTRSILAELIGRYGPPMDIPVRLLREINQVALGEYRFTPGQFQALIGYVWVGGYPRWRDERRPAYVEGLKEAFEKARGFPFEGINENIDFSRPQAKN